MNPVEMIKAWWSGKSVPVRGGGGGGGGRRDLGQYDAGKANRFDMDFMPAMTGINALADQYLPLARRRMRSAFANMPHLRGAAETFANNTVGEMGIYPQPNTGDRELDKVLTEIWWESADAVDPARKFTSADEQRLWVKEMVSVGEFCRNCAVADAWRGYARGPAIETIDTDRIDIGESVWGNAKTAAGLEVRQGVVVDRLGREVSYRVYKQHPADGSMSAFAGMLETTDISADNCTLAFRRDRAGQLRGVPPAVAALGDMRHLAGYRETEIVRARMAASVAFWIKGLNGTQFLKSDADGDLVDWKGDGIERMENGLVLRLPKDGEFGASSANLPGPSYGMVVEDLTRASAAGLNMSYEAFTRDFSKTTFASARSAILEERKQYRPLQAFIWQHGVRLHYERVVMWAWISGRLKLTGAQAAKWAANPRWLFTVTVIAPGWEWVNPYQEAQASEVELRTGITTLADKCAERGKHWMDVVDQRIREEQYWRQEREKAGLPEAGLYGGAPAVVPASPEPDGDEEGDGSGADPAPGDGGKKKSGDQVGGGGGGRMRGAFLAASGKIGLEARATVNGAHA